MLHKWKVLSYHQCRSYQSFCLQYLTIHTKLVEASYFCRTCLPAFWKKTGNDYVHHWHTFVWCKGCWDCSTMVYELSVNTQWRWTWVPWWGTYSLRVLWRKAVLQQRETLQTHIHHLVWLILETRAMLVKLLFRHGSICIPSSWICSLKHLWSTSDWFDV